MYLEPTTVHCVIVSDTFLSIVIIEIHSKRAMLVIDSALLWVTQDGMGCIDLFEYFCSLRVSWVLVWMILQGQSPTQANPPKWVVWGGDGRGDGGRVRVNDRDTSLATEKACLRHVVQEAKFTIPIHVTWKGVMAPIWFQGLLGLTSGSEGKASKKGSTKAGCEPVSPLDLFRGGALLQLQHCVEGGASLGQPAGRLVHMRHVLGQRRGSAWQKSHKIS